MKVFAFLAILTTTVGIVPAGASTTEIHYSMGTYLSITIDGLADKRARTLMRRCFGAARQLEEVFSRYDPASELSRLNARAGRNIIEVSPTLGDLLARSLRLQTATGGAFDVTIGALTPIRGPVGHLPDEARRYVRLLDNRQLSIASGVQLDFDGIAKGYAVDRCVAVLRAAGVERALLSFGESSQYAMGAPIGSRAWTLQVRDLDGEHSLGTLELRDQALSVSSAFRRGRNVAHIVDPRNGRPLREPSVAVVVARSATDAEAWSKALLIAGEQPTAFETQPAALRITRRGIERLGEVAFSAYQSPRSIGPDAEPFL